MAINCCKSYVGKQIIGLLPSQVDCLFYYSPNVPVGGYTVEGIPFDLDADINSVLNPYGIYYTNYYDSTDNYNFIMTYVGVSQPTYVPIIEDSLGNPVTITWDSCCTKTCYEVTLNTDWTTDYCQYFDFGNNILPFFPDGFPLNDQAAWQTVLELFYGPQVVVTNTVTSTTVYLKIDNAYVCGTPRIQTYLIPYTDMVPCGTPADECMYYATINLGNPNSVNYSDFYLDQAATIPAFDPGINGYNGDGNLRNLLQSLGGDIFGIVCNGGPFDGTFYCHIVGTSTYGILIYDSNGSIVNGLNFEKATTYGMSCKPNSCYTATIDQPQIRLVTLEIYSYFYLNIDYQFAQSYKYGSLYMDLSDMIQMQEFCNRLYGSTCIYDYKDNGNGTYTIQISNAYNLGAAPIFYVSDGSSYQQVYLNLC